MFDKGKIIWLIKFLLIATLAMPLMVDNGVAFPFIFTKVIYFRILIELALLLYLILIYKHKEYLPRFNFFILSGGIFLLLSIIISYFGVDWNFSFFNGYERMDGIFSLIHYFVFAFLLTTIFTKKDWLIFLRIFLSISIIVILRGFYEAKNLGIERVSSSLGNPIYFGEYSLFLFWISLLFSFLTKIKWERYISYFLAFLSIIGIFISGSRGPFLSFLAGLGVFFLVYFFITRNRKFKFSILILITLGIFLVLGGVFLPGNILVRNIPIINNLSDLRNLDETVSNRVLVANIAIEAFKEKPILGWGFDNFSTAFNINYKAEFLRRGWGDTFFDSAHNYYLDILVGLGVLGIISFLSIFILAIYRVVKKIIDSEYKIFFSLILALLVSILSQLFFSFLHPVFYLCLFLSFGFVVYAVYGQQKKDITISNIKSLIINILVSFLILLSLGGLFYGNIASYIDNHSSDKVRLLIYNKDIEAALFLTEKNLEHTDPLQRETVRDYVRYWVAVDIPVKYREEYVKLLKDLEFRLNENLEKYNKNNTLDYLFLMRANIALNIFEDRSDRIEDIFIKASAVNDKKQELNFLYFNYLIQSEKINEAKELMEKIINDDPEIYYGYWYLSRIYVYLGETERAYDYYNKAVERGFVAESIEDKDIVNFLLNKMETLK